MRTACSCFQLEDAWVAEKLQICLSRKPWQGRLPSAIAPLRPLPAEFNNEADGKDVLKVPIYFHRADSEE